MVDHLVSPRLSSVATAGDPLLATIMSPHSRACTVRCVSTNYPQMYRMKQWQRTVNNGENKETEMIRKEKGREGENKKNVIVLRGHRQLSST